MDMRKYAFSRNYLVNSVQLRVFRFQGKQNLEWSISGLGFGEVKGVEKEKSVPIFWWKTRGW